MTPIKRLRSIIASAAILLAAFAATAQLPSVQLKNLDGKPVDSATLSNDGRPYVVSFFATWCKPCLRELKAIAEVYPDWQDETGMKLIAISVDEAQNAGKVRPLVDAQAWEYEVLLDSNSELMRAMGVQTVPHVLIFDGDGKIVDTRSGYTEGSEAHIIEKIRQLID